MTPFPTFSRRRQPHISIILLTLLSLLLSPILFTTTTTTTTEAAGAVSAAAATTSTSLRNARNQQQASSRIPILRRYQYNDKRTDFQPLIPSQMPSFWELVQNGRGGGAQRHQVSLPVPSELSPRYGSKTTTDSVKRWKKLHTPLKVQFRISGQFLTPWITILDPKEAYRMEEVNFAFYGQKRLKEISRVHVEANEESRRDLHADSTTEGIITDTIPITFTYKWERIRKDMASDLAMGYLFSVCLVAVCVVSMYRLVLSNLNQISLWINERNASGGISMGRLAVNDTADVKLSTD